MTARYRPSEQRILLGGDFYDVVERPDGSIAFVIGDVMGHGPGPAAIGAALRATWRGLAAPRPRPGRLAGRHGDGARQLPQRPDVLVTACTGSISPDGSTVTFAGAGHPHPILLAAPAPVPRAARRRCPLGVEEPGRTFTVASEPLPAGARLLLYTDGVIEARTGKRTTDRFGEEGLSSGSGPGRRATTAATLLDDLVAELERLNAAPLDDDLALVLLERR